MICVAALVLCLFSPLTASMIRISPAEAISKDTLYKDLPCSDEDTAKIIYIIETVASKSKMALLLQYQSDLKRTGTEVNHVHPLKFLSIVFDPATPVHAKWMLLIESDSFKWSDFMGGLGAALTRESARGTLANYLPDFAAEVGADPHDLEPFCQSKDWPGFVRHLIFKVSR